MLVKLKLLLRKIGFTLGNFRSVAHHHYGRNPLSMPKMIYYSLLKVNTFVLFERALDHDLDAVDLAPEYTVIEPGGPELDMLRQRRQLPREFYYDRLHGIGRCHVVMHGSEPAYIHWIYVKGDANRFLKLGDGVAEVNYITTLPGFRGRKLMSSMMVFAMNDLKRLGYRKLVSVVNALNAPALKSMRAAGFKEVRRIRTLGYLNRKYPVEA